MDARDLISVYSCINAGEAEVLRNALQSEGIACRIDGEGQAGLAGVLELRLLVRAIDADRARAYIEKHEGQR